MSSTVGSTQTTAMTEAGAGATTGSSITTYQWPLANYENESGQWLVMNEFMYTRPSNSTIVNAKPTNRVFKLPLPHHNMVARYDAEWEGIDVGMIWNAAMNKFDGARKSINDQGGLGSAIKNIPSGILQDVLGTTGLKGMKETITNMASDVVSSMTAGAVDTALGTEAGKVGGIYAGVARNPFVAMAFKGVKLRSFKFEWEFFAESHDESVAINNIITALKYGMHPSFNSLGGYQNLLFEYPNIYKPEFSGENGGARPFLFDFGYCVITGLDVNYHGQNAPIYFEHGGQRIPAIINLGLSLNEIEIVTKEKIAGVGTNTTGR